MASELVETPANKVVQLGEQVRSIVSGTPIEKDAMIIAAMFQSGYYGDVQSVSQAITRALIGQTMGLDVVRSMNNIYITPDSKIALEAEAIKSIYGRAGYSARTKELNNDGCILEWKKGDEVLGTSEFTKEDAIIAEYIDPECTEFPIKHNVRKITRFKRGGQGSYEIDGCNCKANYKHHPKDMFLARAITRGARMYADDSFGGNSVYARDEIEDIGQTVTVNQPVESDATVTDAPKKKEVKSYVHAPEAETVPEPPPPVEQSVEPVAASTENEDTEAERKEIIASIQSAAELLDIKPKDLKDICLEVSGKNSPKDLTVEELTGVYEYLEEIERQENKEAEARGIKTPSDVENVQEVFEGARQLPLT